MGNNDDQDDDDDDDGKKCTINSSIKLHNFYTDNINTILTHTHTHIPDYKSNRRRRRRIFLSFDDVNVVVFVVVVVGGDDGNSIQIQRLSYSVFRKFFSLFYPGVLYIMKEWL